MKPQDPHFMSISEVGGELRSWGGVAIVGAGLSVLAGISLPVTGPYGGRRYRRPATKPAPGSGPTR